MLLVILRGHPAAPFASVFDMLLLQSLYPSRQVLHPSLYWQQSEHSSSYDLGLSHRPITPMRPIDSQVLRACKLAFYHRI